MLIWRPRIRRLTAADNDGTKEQLLNFCVFSLEIRPMGLVASARSRRRIEAADKVGWVEQFRRRWHRLKLLFHQKVMGESRPALLCALNYDLVYRGMKDLAVNVKSCWRRLWSEPKSLEHQLPADPLVSCGTLRQRVRFDHALHAHFSARHPTVREHELFWRQLCWCSVETGRNEYRIPNSRRSGLRNSDRQWHHVWSADLVPRSFHACDIFPVDVNRVKFGSFIPRSYIERFLYVAN